MESSHERNSEIFKALCDPKRLAILQLLRSGEKCACVLMEQLGMASPQSLTICAYFAVPV